MIHARRGVIAAVQSPSRPQARQIQVRRLTVRLNTPWESDRKVPRVGEEERT